MLRMWQANAAQTINRRRAQDMSELILNSKLVIADTN